MLARFLLYCIVLTCTSCAASGDDLPEEAPQVITVDVQSTQTASLTDMFSETIVQPVFGGPYYNPQEAADFALVGNTLYVAYNGDSTTIVTYENGVHAATIMLPKEGPNSIRSVSKFAVAEDHLRLLSRSGRSFMDLDLATRTGRAVVHEMYAMDFVSLADNELLLYTANDATVNTKKLVRIDTTGQLLAEFLPMRPDRRYINVFTKGEFARDGTDILFLEPYSSTIHAVRQDSLYPAYTIEFGGAGIPADYYEKEYNDIAEFSIPLFKSDWAHGAGSLFATPDYLVFNYWRGDDQCLAVYDRRGGQTTALTGVRHALLGKASIDNLNEYGVQVVSNAGYLVWLYDERGVPVADRRGILEQAALGLTAEQVEQRLAGWDAEYRYAVVLTR